MRGNIHVCQDVNVYNSTSYLNCVSIAHNASTVLSSLFDHNLMRVLLAFRYQIPCLLSKVHWTFLFSTYTLYITHDIQYIMKKGLCNTLTMKTYSTFKICAVKIILLWYKQIYVYTWNTKMNVIKITLCICKCFVQVTSSYLDLYWSTILIGGYPCHTTNNLITGTVQITQSLEFICYFGIEILCYTSTYHQNTNVLL